MKKLLLASAFFIVIKFNAQAQSVFGSWPLSATTAATSPTPGITASPNTGSGAFNLTGNFAMGGIWADASGSTSRVLSDYWEYKITTDASTSAIVTSFALNYKEVSQCVTVAIYYSSDGVTWTQAGSNKSICRTSFAAWATGNTGLNIVLNPSTSFYLRFYGWADGSGAVYNQNVSISGTTGPNCIAPCLQWLNQNCSLCTSGCYIDGGTVVPAPVIQTASTSTSVSNYGYVFWTFNASADSTYYFDLCASAGTTGDSWLRLHKSRTSGANYCDANATDTTLVIQNNQNGCTGTASGLSKLIWTCQQTGTYYLESAVGANESYWGITGSQTASLSYKTLPSSSVISTCTDTIYDKGNDGTDGSSFNYNNDESWNYTYYPSDTTMYAVSVTFLSFSTSPGDVLCIYDGNSINAPLIGCFSGPSITGGTHTSSASDGSLTFQFSSDDSLVSTGWQAGISCVLRGVGVNNNYSSTDKIYISPNPVKESLVISHQSLVIKEIGIYNVIGEKVFSPIINSQSVINNSSIDVSSLLPGVYFIRIENDKGNWNGRFVKQ